MHPKINAALAGHQSDQINPVNNDIVRANAPASSSAVSIFCTATVGGSREGDGVNGIIGDFLSPWMIWCSLESPSQNRSRCRVGVYPVVAAQTILLRFSCLQTDAPNARVPCLNYPPAMPAHRQIHWPKPTGSCTPLTTR